MSQNIEREARTRSEQQITHAHVHVTSPFFQDKSHPSKEKLEGAKSPDIKTECYRIYLIFVFSQHSKQNNNLDLNNNESPALRKSSLDLTVITQTGIPKQKSTISYRSFDRLNVWKWEVHSSQCTSLAKTNELDTNASQNVPTLQLWEKFQKQPQ